jgi:hypothetical protein
VRNLLSCRPYDQVSLNTEGTERKCLHIFDMKRGLSYLLLLRIVPENQACLRRPVCAQIRSLMFVFILTLGLVDSLESLQHAVEAAAPGPRRPLASFTASTAKVTIVLDILSPKMCVKSMTWFPPTALCASCGDRS